MPVCLLDYAGNLARDKHSGVLQNFVMYGQFFMILVPDSNIAFCNKLE